MTVDQLQVYQPRFSELQTLYFEWGCSSDRPGLVGSRTDIWTLFIASNLVKPEHSRVQHVRVWCKPLIVGPVGNNCTVKPVFKGLLMAERVGCGTPCLIWSLLMAEQVGCGTPRLLWSLGMRNILNLRPDRNINARKQKCSSIPNYKSSPWRSVSYRPTVSPSYEASSHVKNYAYSGKLLLLSLL